MGIFDDPIKGAEQAGQRVADHIGKSLPGVVDAITNTLGDDEVVITIPEIKITISFRKRV